MSPPRESSPHSVELIFEGEVRVAPLPDESIQIIEGLGSACFEPFRVVQNDVIVLGWGESFVKVSLSRLIVFNANCIELNQQIAQLAAHGILAMAPLPNSPNGIHD